MTYPLIQNILIRRMTPEDIEEVYQIEKLSFSLPWSIRSYQFELSENPSSRSWVAQANLKDGTKRIVGMSVIWLILDEAHVANLAVHPCFRKLNIGKKILAHSIKEILGEGARQFFLEVRTGNLVAQKIYSGLGFEVTGIRKNYYKDTNEDALLMSTQTVDRSLIDKWANLEIPASARIKTKPMEVVNGS